MYWQVYSALDNDDTRYFGKEIVSVLVSRLGKSLTALGLGVLSAYRPDWMVRPVGLVAIWCLCSARLVLLLKPKTD